MMTPEQRWVTEWHKGECRENYVGRIDCNIVMKGDGNEEEKVYKLCRLCKDEYYKTRFEADDEEDLDI